MSPKRFILQSAETSFTYSAPLKFSLILLHPNMSMSADLTMQNEDRELKISAKPYFRAALVHLRVEGGGNQRPGTVFGGIYSDDNTRFAQISYEAHATNTITNNDFDILTILPNKETILTMKGNPDGSTGNCNIQNLRADILFI